MTSGLGVLIAASAVLVFWVVGAYNRLERLKNAIGAAFGQLDEQLRRRHELIDRLMAVVGVPPACSGLASRRPCRQDGPSERASGG